MRVRCFLFGWYIVVVMLVRVMCFLFDWYVVVVMLVINSGQQGFTNVTRVS